MNRRHYEQLAGILRQDVEDPELRRLLGERIAAVCQEDNPLFDRERFLRAAAAGAEPEGGNAPSARIRETRL